MIDVVKNDTLLSLADAARALPRVNGKKPHTSTLWRWCRTGVRARTGERIRLDHVRIGSRIFTNSEAMNAFATEVAAADATYFDRVRPTPSKAPTDKQHQRSIAQAESQLKTAGVLR